MKALYAVGRCLLSDILKKSHMTQQELADQLQVTKQQVNSYATNRRVMTFQIAYNIAAILRCDMKDLYEWKIVKDKRR